MAYYSQQHDDFRQGPSSHYAPPLQHNYDSYPMNDVHSPSPHHNEAYYDPDGMYDQYQNKAPLPPAHQQSGYQYLDDPNYNNTKEIYDYDEKERRSCCDRICCGCCTCCPRWARYCSCFFLLIIIALGIVIGVLAAIFKKPSIEFGGIQGTPQFNLNGTTAYMQFNMNITVDNPNVESVTFSNIEAKAFYPNLAGLDLSKTPIGGGNKSDVHISSNGVTTIIFPFTLEFDALGTTTKPIINDLLNKCGITGGEKQDITINYDVTPNINIIGIPISFTISSSSSFACPDDVAKGVSGVLGPLASMIGAGGGALPSDISGLTSMIGSGASGVPTSLLSSLPSGIPTSF